MIRREDLYERLYWQAREEIERLATTNPGAASILANMQQREEYDAVERDQQKWGPCNVCGNIGEMRPDPFLEEIHEETAMNFWCDRDYVERKDEI